MFEDIYKLSEQCLVMRLKWIVYLSWLLSQLLFKKCGALFCMRFCVRLHCMCNKYWIHKVNISVRCFLSKHRCHCVVILTLYVLTSTTVCLSNFKEKVKKFPTLWYGTTVSVSFIFWCFYLSCLLTAKWTLRFVKDFSCGKLS